MNDFITCRIFSFGRFFKTLNSLQMRIMLRWHTSIVLSNIITWRWKCSQIFILMAFSPYSKFLLKGEFFLPACQNSALTLKGWIGYIKWTEVAHCWAHWQSCLQCFPCWQPPPCRGCLSEEQVSIVLLDVFQIVHSCLRCHGDGWDHRVLWRVCCAPHLPSSWGEEKALDIRLQFWVGMNWAFLYLKMSLM